MRIIKGDKNYYISKASNFKAIEFEHVSDNLTSLKLIYLGRLQIILKGRDRYEFLSHWFKANEVQTDGKVYTF